MLAHWVAILRHLSIASLVTLYRMIRAHQQTGRLLLHSLTDKDGRNSMQWCVCRVVLDWRLTRLAKPWALTALSSSRRAARLEAVS